MKDEQQVASLDGLVDCVGFIFYPPSKRFVQATPKTKQSLRVGVFVDESITAIIEKVNDNSIDIVQLHGNETPSDCRTIRLNSKVIKAFGMDQSFNFKLLIPYEGTVDYFLFDTKTPLKGGSGIQFDWSILDLYNLTTPFILSGGIDENSIDSIKKIHHPKLMGIDLNSRFENAPGDKNIERIKKFIYELNN
jgi:phosphoribosylanthranilate isomerase